MSYHARKSAGQRSTGLIFVVAFHILLIWGFASGLANKVAEKIPEILKAEVVKEEQVVEKEPPPPPPDIKLPPPNLDFVPDAPAASTAIVAVQREQPKPIVPSALTKARVPPKGLSRPEYPSASIRLGEEGSTGLNLYLNEEGRVTEAQVSSTSGSERLDEAAVKHAQRSWKFVPCMQGDKPVACWHQIKFTWRIEDAKK